MVPKTLYLKYIVSLNAKTEQDLRDATLISQMKKVGPNMQRLAN